MESKYWPKKLKDAEGNTYWLRADNSYYKDSRLKHAGVANYSGPLGRSSDFESEIGIATLSEQG